MTATRAIVRELDKGIAALDNALRPGLKTRKQNAWINASQKHMRRADKIHHRNKCDAIREERERAAIAIIARQREIFRSDSDRQREIFRIDSDTQRTQS